MVPSGGRPNPDTFIDLGFHMLNGWWDCKDMPPYTMLSDYHVGQLIKENLVTADITNKQCLAD